MMGSMLARRLRPPPPPPGQCAYPRWLRPNHGRGQNALAGLPPTLAIDTNGGEAGVGLPTR